MEAYIDECAESSNVGNDSRQLHPYFQILQLVNIVRKSKLRRLLARIEPRLGKLLDNIGNGRKTGVAAYKILGLDTGAQLLIAHQFAGFHSQRGCHRIDYMIRLRMYCRAVQRIGGAANP